MTFLLTLLSAANAAFFAWLGDPFSLGSAVLCGLMALVLAKKS